MKRTDEELDQLLGAYALHAVEADERSEIEEYLIRSPQARAEVDSHVRVAAALGNSSGPAPAGLWPRIRAAVDSSPQAPQVAPPTLPRASGIDAASARPDEPSNPGQPLSPLIDLDRRRGRAGSGSRSRALPTRLPIGLVAASVAFVAAASFSIWQNQRITSLRNDVSAARANAARDQLRVNKLEIELASTNTDEARVGRITSRPSGRVVQLIAGSHNVARVVYDPTTGEAFLINGDLPSLPSGKTYQLWGVHGTTVLSLGVLGRQPHSSPFTADGIWDAFVLTEEWTPGVTSSANPALAVGKVTSF